MDGFLSSPAAGWVTSAPKNITGSVLKKDGLLKNIIYIIGISDLVILSCKGC